MMRAIHAENHRTHRIGWLRAAVLGANDGVVSTAALIVGVAGAGSDRGTVLIAGLAGLVAGAMSMAAGEYVSVSSQADAEAADRAREQEELATMPEAELAELRDIYVERGLDAELATRVAEQLMAGDALKAHLRDELGITERLAARPLQAAAVSAATFSVGAALPLGVAALAPSHVALWVSVATLAVLLVLGGLGSHAGGAPIRQGAMRVAFWGALALIATLAVGMVFGVAAG
ncbi:VIT family protein [Paracoccus yeei]